MNSDRSKTDAAQSFKVGGQTTFDEDGNSRRLRRDIERLQHSGRSLSSHHQLVVQHAKTAYLVAYQYRGKGIAYDDLVSEAMLGLLEAAQEYNPARGSFSTYAWWVCRRFVQQLIRKHRRQAGISIDTQRSMPPIWTAFKDLTQELDRAPELSELAERTGIPAKRIKKLLRLAQVQTVSLQTRTGEEDEQTLEDHIADARSTNPEDRMILREEISTIPDLRRQLYQAVMALSVSDQQKRVFICRYRLDEPGVVVRTEEVVARIVGVSSGRVSQILHLVWWRLKHHPIIRLVNHEWLRRLPERVMVLADLFGEHEIEHVFGPREQWELPLRTTRRKVMPRRKTSPSVNGVSKDFRVLHDRLTALKTPAATTLLSIVERLPHLSNAERKVVILRFGFADGSCRRMTTDEVGTTLKLKATSVGTQTFTAIRKLRRHGLPESIDVRKLNAMVEEVCQQLSAQSETIPPPVTMSARQGETQLATADGQLPPQARQLLELRHGLDTLARQRRQEEEVLRLWIVGPPDRFGPLSIEEIAEQIGLKPEVVNAILAKTVLALQ